MTALTLEPASAVAVAHCLVSRLQGASRVHPRPCAWEDYTRAELARMLDRFHVEAEYTDRHGWRAPEVERFRSLTPSDQRAAVHAAQYQEAA